MQTRSSELMNERIRAAAGRAPQPEPQSEPEKPAPVDLGPLRMSAETASEEMSVAEAHRVSGISVKALLAAIRDGRLEVPDERCPGEHPGRRWKITPEALERFVAACPTCAWPGCERLGVTPAGRCSKQHAATLERLHSAEVQAKAAAAQRGVRRGPYPPERAAHIREALAGFYADPERSQRKRCVDSERMRRSWETGEGAAPALVASKGGRTRSKLFGRWAARKAGRAGGRERGYTDLQAKGVLQLKRDDPTLGYRRLAKKTGLSEKQVRAILIEG